MSALLVAHELAILTVFWQVRSYHNYSVRRLLILIVAFVGDIALVPRPAFAHPIKYDREVAKHNDITPHNNTLRVFVHSSDGGPVDAALVILKSTRGQVQEATTQAGCVDFSHVYEGWYDLEIIAAGYKPVRERMELSGAGANSWTVTLKTAASMEDSVGVPGAPILAPKAKKELGKAQEALHARNLSAARSHLEAAYRLAPGNPDVNYVFGIYCLEKNDLEKAKGYLQKVLDLDPKHAGALRALGILFLRENMPIDSVPYLKLAIEVEPTSWRAHALLAEACLRQGLVDESVSQAERALELGHGAATIVEPVLAHALANRGETERATRVLQKYVQDHASDAAARKQLEDLKVASLPNEARSQRAEVPPVITATSPTVTPFLSSSWLPADIDETIPPVESGAPCAGEEVVKNAAERVQEFVSNVNRFTATETITHETVDRWGIASSPRRFKFDYLVSIEEIRPGFLDVAEFRSSAYSAEEFPDGIVASGLPALILIFHPTNVDHFEITCEGLAHRNGALAWQMHFRQRNDKPNTTRSYILGENGPSYPAPLKGRAWIAADSYQIERLEIDLIAPIPEIRLVADHTVVEYGAVHFRKNSVEMWLPQTAEFYYDWRGHRGHRVHRFSNYLLFSVDDRQHISPPKPER